jgi:hypothetical protein
VDDLDRRRIDAAIVDAARVRPWYAWRSSPETASRTTCDWASPRSTSSRGLTLTASGSNPRADGRTAGGGSLGSATLAWRMLHALGT